MFSDGGFETGVADWSQVGNHTCSRVTYDYHSGSACMEIIATGAGNSVNCIFKTLNLTAGNKYTLEFWGKLKSGTTRNCNFVDQISGNNAIVFSTTWTKYVFNRLCATSSPVYPQWQLAAADTVLIDDVSLTPAWDAIIISIVKSSKDYSGGVGSFLDCVEFTQRFATTNNMTTKVSDGTTSIYPTGGTVINNGLSNVLITTLNRTGNATNYVNGSLEAGTLSMTAIGKLLATPVTVGAGAGGSAFILGSCSSVQIVRGTFTDAYLAQVVAQIWAQKKPLAAYPNGQVVGWWDWKNGGYDKSGNGNHLTNTGGASIVRIK